MLGTFSILCRWDVGRRPKVLAALSSDRPAFLSVPSHRTSLTYTALSCSTTTDAGLHLLLVKVGALFLLDELLGKLLIGRPSNSPWTLTE